MKWFYGFMFGMAAGLVLFVGLAQAMGEAPVQLMPRIDSLCADVMRSATASDSLRIHRTRGCALERP